MRTVALKRPELSAFDVEDAGPHFTVVFDCSAHPSDTNSFTLPDDLAAESRSADDLLTAQYNALSLCLLMRLPRPIKS